MNTTKNQPQDGQEYAWSYNALINLIRAHATPAKTKARAKRELSIRRITGSSADDCCHEIAHISRDSYYSDTNRLELFNIALKREESKSNRKSVIQKLKITIQRLEKVAA